MIFVCHPQNHSEIPAMQSAAVETENARLLHCLPLFLTSDACWVCHVPGTVSPSSGLGKGFPRAPHGLRLASPSQGLLFTHPSGLSV